MARIDRYQEELASELSPNDILLGQDAESGATRKFPLSALTTYLSGGKTITSTTFDADGDLTIHYNDGTSDGPFHVLGMTGPAGANGAQGPAGQAVDRIDVNKVANATELTFFAGADNLGTVSIPDGAQGETGPQGPAGADGADGESAYEIWLAQPGNAGRSMQDFLNSLVGEQGEQGDPGATGQRGPQGDRGETGAQGPIGPGITEVTGTPGTNPGDPTELQFFIGPEGSRTLVGMTEVQSGADGADGAVGPQGPPGPMGSQGLPGPTGNQGPQGDQGIQGFQGIGVSNTSHRIIPAGEAFAGDTEVTIEFNDPSGATTPGNLVFIVEKGEDGATGAIGPSGARGQAGNTILSGTGAPNNRVLGAVGDFYIDTDADVIYGPKTSTNADNWPLTGTSLVGPMGMDGDAGPAGPEGPQGTYRLDIFIRSASMPTAPPDGSGTITDGVLTAAPTGWSLTVADTTGTDTLYESFFTYNPARPANTIMWSQPFEAGAQGPTGMTGPEGPQGPPGMNGTDGTDGMDGTDGTDGLSVGTVVQLPASPSAGQPSTLTFALSDGTTIANTINLPAGARGADGNDGMPGDDGDDGLSIGSVTQTPATPALGEASVLTFALSDGTAVTGMVNLPSGVAGATGADGPAGAAGADGRTILNGTGAPDAALGEDGDFYIDTMSNEIYGPKTAGAWGDATSLIGPTGDAGADGMNGMDGADGRTILNGTGSPDDDTLGDEGDFYIDTMNNEIYGPKGETAWPDDGTSLVGPQGPQGLPGADGTGTSVTVTIDDISHTNPTWESANSVGTEWFLIMDSFTVNQDFLDNGGTATVNIYRATSTDDTTGTVAIGAREPVIHVGQRYRVPRGVDGNPNAIYEPIFYYEFEVVRYTSSGTRTNRRPIEIRLVNTVPTDQFGVSSDRALLQDIVAGTVNVETNTYDIRSFLNRGFDFNESTGEVSLRSMGYIQDVSRQEWIPFNEEDVLENMAEEKATHVLAGTVLRIHGNTENQVQGTLYIETQNLYGEQLATIGGTFLPSGGDTNADAGSPERRYTYGDLIDRITDVDGVFGIRLFRQFINSTAPDGHVQVQFIEREDGRVGASALRDTTKQDTIDVDNRLNANLIADGSVSNEEFQRLDGVTGDIQTQLDGKVDDAQVLTNVPANAVFTDTQLSQAQVRGFIDKTYVDGLNINAATVTGFTVGTNVPAGALFTDTFATFYVPGDTALTTVNSTSEVAAGVLTTIPVVDASVFQANVSEIRIVDTSGNNFDGLVTSVNTTDNEIVVRRETPGIQGIATGSEVFLLTPQPITHIVDTNSVSFNDGVVTVVASDVGIQAVETNNPITGDGTVDDPLGFDATLLADDAIPQSKVDDLEDDLASLQTQINARALTEFVEATVNALDAVEVPNSAIGERVQTSANVDISWSNAQLVDNADDDYITIDANETAQAFDIVVDGRNLYASGNNGLDVAFIGTVRSDTLFHTNVIHLDRGDNTQAEVDEITQLLTDFGSELWIANENDLGVATFFTNSYTTDIRGDLRVRGELDLGNQLPQSDIEGLEDALTSQATLDRLNGATGTISPSLLPDIQYGDVYVYEASGANLAAFITAWGGTGAGISPNPTGQTMHSGELIHVIDEDDSMDTVHLYVGDPVAFQGTLEADSFIVISGNDGVFRIEAGTGLATDPANGIISSGTISLNADTGDIPEGDNLYYTDARARAAFTEGFGVDIDATAGTISLDTNPANIARIIEATPATLGDGFRLEVSSVDDTPVTFLEFTGSVNNVFTHNGSFINARISSNRNNLNQPITNATAGLNVYSSNDNGVTVEYVATTVSGVNNNNDPNTIRLQVGGTSTQAIVDGLNARDLDGYQIWIANDGIGTTETTFDAELANIQVDGDLDVEANATVSGDLTVTGDIISDSLLTVTANPAGTDGASLTRIEIDGVNYNIVGGSSPAPTLHYRFNNPTNLHQEDGSLSNMSVGLTGVTTGWNWVVDSVVFEGGIPTGFSVSGLNTNNTDAVISIDDSVVDVTSDTNYHFTVHVTLTDSTGTSNNVSNMMSYTLVISPTDTRVNAFYGFSTSATITSLNDLVQVDGTTTGGTDTGQIMPSAISTRWPSPGAYFLYLVTDSSVTLTEFTLTGFDEAPITTSTISGRNVFRVPIALADTGDTNNLTLTYS